MNKIIAILMTLLLTLSMVSSVLAVEVYDGELATGVQDVVTYDKITLLDGEVLGDVEYAYEPNFFQKIWSSLFGGDSKNFVSEEASSVSAGYYSCSLSKTAGAYTHTPGRDSLTGGSCSDGQFIVFKSNGGEIESGKLLFDEAWYKDGDDRGSTDWLPNFKNYYLDDLEFSYSYSCYTCSNSIVPSGSSEPGCLNYDKDDCVTADDSSCRTDYGFESVCLSYVQAESISCLTGTGPLQVGQEYCWDSNDGVCDSSKGEPTYTSDCNTPAPSTDVDINFAQIQVTNNGNLVEGQQYEITGSAKVDGTCDGCVIETGLSEYGTSLSILSSSTGACGDDKTSGIKFNAKDEYVQFRLTDIASETGRFSVKIYATDGCQGEGAVKLLDIDTFTVNVESAPEEEIIVPDKEKCYYCDGDNSAYVEATSCPDGTSEVEQNCPYDQEGEDGEIIVPPPVEEPITCNYCYGDELKTTEAEGTCPDGTTLEDLTCGGTIPTIPPSCLSTPEAEGCDPEEADITCDPLTEECCLDAVYTSENPDDCFAPPPEDEFELDFKLYAIIGASALILIGVLIYLSKGGKKK